MHPIWFVVWAWEKAWSPEGLFPLLEHNQGLLSIFALITALILASVEQRRAISAEAIARDSDAAQDRRALAASQDADRRMAEASAEADRKARSAIAAADRKAALQASRADIIERLRFIDVVSTLVAGFKEIAQQDTSVLTANITASGDRERMMPRGWQNAAAEAQAALEAILPSAPRDPGIILSTQRIIRALHNVSFGPTYTFASALLSTIDEHVRGVDMCLAQLEMLRPRDLAPLPMRKARRRAG